ncbi:dTMP kinase [Pontiella sulfatireligans]|uniref:Thymidylate kinase n=1 Tax=Pontiella sulfatireligans TaxID=2750658 RepID=A0A6C2UN38_9BACT|nr:dTMP kinase [Pontiella sulfatireligans]VGO21353.1 Thymidylate kinase [Pontiella sulfatireligans]
MSGRFITFEGPEGSGKSTQIRLLAETLEVQGIEVVCSREPGGTATGEAVRNILQHDAAGEPLSDRAELLLFTASRAQLMDQVILPTLEKGGWVLCDRFIDSTMAYQGFARGMDIDTLDAVNDFAIYGRKPDLTLLLDFDIELGFQRLAARYADGEATHDRFELEARDFHRRVRDGYHQLAEREPERFRIVDASGSVEEVASCVWDVVKEVLL